MHHHRIWARARRVSIYTVRDLVKIYRRKSSLSALTPPNQLEALRVHILNRKLKKNFVCNQRDLKAGKSHRLIQKTLTKVYYPVRPRSEYTLHLISGTIKDNIKGTKLLQAIIAREDSQITLVLIMVGVKTAALRGRPLVNSIAGVQTLK